MKLVVIALAMLALAGRAHAQPAAAFGKSREDAQLPAGTLVVTVVEGDLTKRAAGVTVKAVVGGATRVATTDASGRATFTGIATGVDVRVEGPGTARSEGFTMGAQAGMRVLLSTKDAVAPSRRPMSGSPHVATELAAGALDVELAIDRETKPPVATEVVLVGYVADGKVTVAKATSDAKGVAHFTRLDTSGRTAYYATTLLARGAIIDRLHAAPVVLEAASAARVLLLGDERSAATPYDDLADGTHKNPPRGKVQVELDGISPMPSARVEVIDAATGKTIASGTGGDGVTTVMLDVAAAPGRALYAEAEVKGERYRSRPFVVAADRGAVTTVVAYPGLVPTFEADAEVDDERADVRMKIQLSRPSWIPYAPKVVIPLPRGAVSPVLADESPAKLTPAGIEVVRPLPPGGTIVRVAFELRGTKGTLAWSLDLPHGAFQSLLAIPKEPGVTVDVTGDSGTQAEWTTNDGRPYIVVRTTAAKGKTMALTVHLPKPPPDVAVQHACRALAPDRKSAVLGKPAPDFALADVKRPGKKLALSSLRGKTTLVNFMASWDMLSGKETPQLVELAKQVPGLAVVRVASDRDASGLGEKAGAAPFPLLLDPPPASTPDDNIGTVTRAWGTTVLPESYLIDKKGVVRFYFANARDWDKPDAIGCLKALDAER